MLRLAEILDVAVLPALALLPRHMDTAPARVLLMAIGLQESRFEHRRQLGNGPARGYWQFEEGSKASRGGVWGVYLHSASNELLRLLCRARDCEFAPRPIWAQLERDDVLAAGVARLMLWTDPKPLPPIGAASEAWDYYLRTWRPGKPHRRTWANLYALAVDAVIPPPPTEKEPTP
jgi:hypothetical protein